MDYRRMIWAPKDSTHAIPIKQVSPRISMLMALDNFGVIYACFTQVNTDSKIMGLYIKELVNQLDRENPLSNKNRSFLFLQNVTTMGIL